MATGNKFYDNLPKEEKKQYAALFHKYSEEELRNCTYLNNYDELLSNFIEKQKNQPKLDLSHVSFVEDFTAYYFINAKKETLFKHAIFYKQANLSKLRQEREMIFDDCQFKQDALFTESFFSKINFSRSHFYGEAIFDSTHFQKSVDFYLTEFEKRASFYQTQFNENAQFKNMRAYGDITFKKASFIGDADFFEAITINEMDFTETHFKKTARLENATICGQLNLLNATSDELLTLKSCSFNTLQVEGLVYKNLNPHGMKGYVLENNHALITLAQNVHKDYYDYSKKINLYISKQQIPLESQHFANKESARLIKDYFEKQNNITEANKYFVIEQDKYIEYLRDDKTKEHNKIGILFALCFNKLTSNFGTNWIRGILFLILWGFFLYSIYELILCKQANCIKDALNPLTLSYLLTFPKNSAHINDLLGFSVLLIGIYIIYRTTYYNTSYSIKKRIFYIGLFSIWLLIVTLFFHQYQTLNEVAKILNPLNMLGKESTPNGHEAPVLFFKAVTLAIIYQIIVAFRQNTRRK